MIQERPTTVIKEMKNMTCLKTKEASALQLKKKEADGSLVTIFKFQEDYYFCFTYLLQILYYQGIILKFCYNQHI